MVSIVDNLLETMKNTNKPLNQKVIDVKKVIRSKTDDASMSTTEYAARNNRASNIMVTQKLKVGIKKS